MVCNTVLLTELPSSCPCTFFLCLSLDPWHVICTLAPWIKALFQQPLLSFQTSCTETRAKCSTCLQAPHGAQRKSQANGDAMCSHAFAEWGGLGVENVLALSSLNWMPLECKASFEISLGGHLKSLDNIIDPFTIILLSMAPGS